ncbi:LamG-like jellyroll fold domain-containing protein [Streptomyces sp. NBC_01237]|uniref:LamG-like jellyroll fold domain-containing protein n=1 Tax=Streptomyces sp. NBC_01237 TaxID=2903790 RepID=UPI002DDA295B|nr:LamG-like jellyroll fold domain-containing protein [Streptomyces sp. NBC_01237]WRZ70824.1 PA14 domain-containing protein [Streptomyces sp. NBC_01237]
MFDHVLCLTGPRHFGSFDEDDALRRQHPRPRALFRALACAAALLIPVGATLVPTAAAAPATPAAAPAGAAATAFAHDDPAIEVNGLKGEYFSMSAPGARDFAELGATVLDPEINFPGLTGAFESATGRTEHTTARWTGLLEAPETGEYTFAASGDNGFRLFLDGNVVIDHWQPDWDNEQTSEPVALTAGEPHEFRLEMFQDTGGANMFLRWSSEKLKKQIVPESAFTPPAGFEVYPVGLGVAEDGTRIQATFEGRVSGVAGVKDHLRIETDTSPMPVKSVVRASDNPKALIVTLAGPVQKGQQVRFAYDGEGGLRSGDETVPEISRTAKNLSTHRLTTSWGDKLDRQHPLPEYPRPQQVRAKWQNLNGPWEFAGATEGERPVFGKRLAERITVPFPVESQLSGLERHEDHMFYRRLVTVPKNWSVGGRGAQRLKLNFDAVDYRATVWVNGTKVTEHTGGYTGFSADITDALKGRGPQEIVVAVTDVTGPDQPKGKQSTNPGGIVYTPSSGIWQTVWMEPVAPASVDTLTTTPDIGSGTLALTVNSADASAGARVKAVARDRGGRTVGTVTGPANRALTLPVRNPHLWSPDDPYLYGLDVTLTDGRSTDTVESYFGMRSLKIDTVGGYQKLVLNGKPFFSLAMLDQGFWPDGLYTQPSDAALTFDLKAQKDLGFNAVRKHIKVESPRWYYHADRLGLLVWQDFVSGDISGDQGRRAFLSQGREMMKQLHNSPSIGGWIVFNEGWGEWDRTETGKIAEAVGADDPSRVVNAHSGVNCCSSKGDSGKGDIIDHHDYVNNDAPFPDHRAAMDGEHGGFTLRTPGHMWPGAPAAIYSGVADKAALTAKYVDNTRTYYLAAAGAELSGSVYTQVSDLENELNGLWTYDRREIKVDPVEVRRINRQVIAAGAAAGDRDALKGGAAWSLDEGRGTTAADSGPNRAPLGLVAGASWTPGVKGSALGFDGAGQYAETRGPVVDTTGAYSVSAWASLDSLPGNYATVVSQDGRRQENPFYLQYGQGAFAFSTPGGHRARLEMKPRTGTWYHLVGVRDGDELKLYVDGKPVATAAAGPADVSTGPLSVGRAKWGGSNGDFFDGSIDQVRVYDRALTDDEVSALHSGERP